MRRLMRVDLMRGIFADQSDLKKLGAPPRQTSGGPAEIGKAGLRHGDGHLIA